MCGTHASILTEPIFIESADGSGIHVGANRVHESELTTDTSQMVVHTTSWSSETLTPLGYDRAPSQCAPLPGPSNVSFSIAFTSLGVTGTTPEAGPLPQILRIIRTTPLPGILGREDAYI